MVFRATKRRYRNGQYEKSESCLIAAHSLAEAAQACTYDWFDLVAIGRGMKIQAYEKTSEPESGLRISATFRKVNGKPARVL